MFRLFLYLHFVCYLSPISQTQFDFLESNSDYAAVAHNSYKLYDNWNSPWAINQAKKRGEDVEKLSGYVGTCSAGHKEGDIGFDYFLFEKWPKLLFDFNSLRDLWLHIVLPFLIS